MKKKPKKNAKRKQSFLLAQHHWQPPKLRFTPTAWAKLRFLRDYGETEVGGFGISHAKDLLLVRDFQLVRQMSSWATVSFDGTSIADFFDQQVDAGRQPEQFARIWIHTHPGECPQPSGTDESTFANVFGESTWAVMFILARGGRSYARLRFNVGPGGEWEIPVEVDFNKPFSGADHAAWESQYRSNVIAQPAAILPPLPEVDSHVTPIDTPFWNNDDLPNEFEDEWPASWLDTEDFEDQQDEQYQS